MNTQATNEQTNQMTNSCRPFPSLEPEGPAVRAKDYVEPGTGWAVCLGYPALFLGLVLLTVATWGVGLVAVVIALIADVVQQKKALAQVRGSALEIGPDQLPELWRCAEVFAQRLGMAAPPALYLAEGNVLNASAIRLAGRQVVVLVDDIVDACLRSGDPRALAFILAHEMAHHALGHTGLLRANLPRMIKRLSRLDELSCDAVANQLVGERRVSAAALTLLLVGPQVYPFVSQDALRQQAQRVDRDQRTRRAERQLSHPMLLRQLLRFQA
jgi:hypothetical protein